MRADFRAMPFRDGSADVVVLDPPYIHAPGRRYFDGRYRNSETAVKDHASIMALYQQGITEATRVLRPAGTVWVKCQDTVESRTQRWSHIEVYAMAASLGLSAQDLFVVMTSTPPGGTSARGKQQHARRNHSYLWIFRKAVTA